MKKNKGITLIALIITIIIMLILVAVSISILINSGLIGKAKQAGEDTKTKYAEESRLGENITIDGTVYNSIDEYIDAVNPSNGEETENSSGGDTIDHPLASAVLKVNPDNDTPEEQSPYVSYHYNDEEGDKIIPCRVLYDDDSEYGLQLISNDIVENVIIGFNDETLDASYATKTEFERSEKSYDGAISKLNHCAEKYIETSDIALSCRCVGSLPSNPYSESGVSQSGFNGSSKGTDTNYISDYNQMTSLGIVKSPTNTSYWLASREVTYNNATFAGYRCMKIIWGSGGLYSSGSLQNTSIYGFNSDGDDRAYSITRGLRICIKLNPDVKIKEGDGTLDSPYELIL